MVETIESHISSPNIMQKWEWDEIALAYKEAIEQFSFYKQLSSEIVSELKDSKKVLDLGCGTGAHLERLLELNPGCEVVGVDSNPRMLGIAQHRLREKHAEKNFRLYYDDATDFNKESGFDAVISSNVLFNLEKPMDYLDNAYWRLASGGKFVLTSPQELTNMDVAENLMREDFRQQGKYEEKKPFIDTVWRVNHSFQGRSNVYKTERMRDILTDFIGFDSILSQKIAYGNNFFFVAKKNETPSEVKYVFSNDAKLLEKGFRLRYHWLFDRYKGIKEHENEIYMDACDNRSVGFFALEEPADKVVGFANYVSPGNDIPFGNKQLLENICKQHGPVGAFNGFYVLRTRQNGRIGVNMIRIFMKDYVNDLGVGALVTEARPEITKGLERFGWRILEMADYATGEKNLPVALMMRAINENPKEYTLQGRTNEPNA